VESWNAAAANGGDAEFGRGADAPMHPIDTPPFYAASLTPGGHDSYGGLRINGTAQVMDMPGEPIPALFAGGEATGGHNQHGLGKGCVHGYIAGTNVVELA
jgi:predicted oxidoreductase